MNDETLREMRELENTCNADVTDERSAQRLQDLLWAWSDELITAAENEAGARASERTIYAKFDAMHTRAMNAEEEVARLSARLAEMTPFDERVGAECIACRQTKPIRDLHLVGTSWMCKSCVAQNAAAGAKGLGG